MLYGDPLLYQQSTLNTFQTTDGTTLVPMEMATSGLVATGLTYFSVILIFKLSMTFNHLYRRQAGQLRWERRDSWAFLKI